MSNFWIVSSHEFVLHATPDEALTEARRLAAKERKPFHVYRVKDKLVPGDDGERVVATVIEPGPAPTVNV